MRRIVSLLLLTAIALSPCTVLALSQDVAEPIIGTAEIDSIVLTISPSFGLQDDLVDAETTIYPDAALTSLLHEHNFFGMPEYLETGVLDGHFTWITVNMRGGEVKRVGGLVAEAFGPEDFIVLYDALMEAKESHAKRPETETDDVLRAAVFPTGTYEESYYFVLNEEGILFCAMGAREGDDIAVPNFLTRTDHSAETALDASDLWLLLTLADEFETSGYHSQKQIVDDGWDVALLYNGKAYEMSYWDNDDSGEFRDLIDRIIELSPIPVDLHGWA